MTKFDTLYRKIISENASDEKADPRIEKALSFLTSYLPLVEPLYRLKGDEYDKKQRKITEEFKEDLINFWKLVVELPDEQTYALVKQAMLKCGGDTNFKHYLLVPIHNLNTHFELLKKATEKLNRISTAKRVNIKVTFHSNYNGWTSDFENDDKMIRVLTKYSASCYNEDGDYVKDIDVGNVKAIVRDIAREANVKNANVEVVEDTLSS